jgi:AcrR family transcriptional regulator
MATQIERREASVLRIEEAAARAIAEHGVEGFTIAEVSQAAGLNRATIYHYFPTREQLVLAALHHLQRKHEGLNPSPTASLKALIENPELARFLFSLMLNGQELPPPPPVLVSAIQRDRERQQQGDIRAEVDPEAFRLLIFLLHLAWGVGREALAEQVRIPVEEADRRVIAELERIVSDIQVPVRNPTEARVGEE